MSQRPPSSLEIQTPVVVVVVVVAVAVVDLFVVAVVVVVVGGGGGVAAAAVVAIAVAVVDFICCCCCCACTTRVGAVQRKTPRPSASHSSFRELAHVPRHNKSCSDSKHLNFGSEFFRRTTHGEREPNRSR